MYELILDTVKNPNVLITIAILGFILAIVSTYYAVKHRKYKKLSLKNWDNTEIFSSAKLSQKKIKVLHANNEVEGIYLLRLELVNTGTETIKNADFHTQPKISFNADINILDIEIDCSEEYIQPTYEMIENDIIVLFTFIEPKDIISLQILYDSNAVCGGKVEAKIIGGNKLLSLFKTNIEYEAYREGKAFGKSIYMVFAGIIFVTLYTIIEKVCSYWLLSSIVQDIMNIIAFVFSFIFSIKIGRRIQRDIMNKRINTMIENGELEASD